MKNVIVLLCTMGFVLLSQNLIAQEIAELTEKHLQIFNKNLVAEGITYTPMILSQKDFDSIINVKASCQGGGKTGKGCCGGKKGKPESGAKCCGAKKGKSKQAKSGACCNSSK